MSDEEAPNLTTRILVEIRDELRKTNDELRKTNERVDALTGEVRKTNERIDTIGRQLPVLLSEMEDRLATTVETWLNQRPVVDMAWRQEIEKRVADLEKKTG